MMLFRCAINTDLDAIYELAQQSGIGMTTLPKNKKLLAQRLHHSLESHQKNLAQPDNGYYLFVLEDLNTHELVGVSAIEAQVGCQTPFYSYKISTQAQCCHSLKIRNDYELLRLVNDHHGASEVCSLFLKPSYRKNQNGLLLSKARFLFMAHAPYRFAPTVLAELRGVCDKQGYSPFWEHVGSHFFHMSFTKADGLTLSTNKQFIADLIPKNPIYIPLLPKEAQDVIGKPHASSLPAMKILMREGFRYNKYVDVFDAGPLIDAPLNDIHTIAQSRLMTVNTVCDEVSSQNYLLANNQLDFRATIHQALLNDEKNTCAISKDTAQLLQLQCGDLLRVSPLHF